MLFAILTFFTKPENLKNAGMKTRLGGKADYITIFKFPIELIPQHILHPWVKDAMYD
jgi:hypothetical protein